MPNYHTSAPRGYHVFLFFFVPGWETGVLLYSKVLLRVSSANIRGLIHDRCKRLRVIVASGRSLHKIYRENCGGIVAYIRMK